MEGLETTLSLLGCFPNSVVPGGSQLLSLQCWDLNLGLVHARQALYRQAMPPEPSLPFRNELSPEPLPRRTLLSSHLFSIPDPSTLESLVLRV